MSALKVGMIGLGVISRFYHEALRESNTLTLSAVCDLRLDRIAPYVEAGVISHTDYRELLARSDLDAVIVNVPNDLHYEICRAALLAGKHVCCEKPLATSAADARALMELAQASQRTLFTAFHRRYNRNVLQAKPLITATAVRRVTAHYKERIEDHAGADGWYLQPERCGGGCVADNGPNVFDTVVDLLGPLEVREALLHCDGAGVDRQAYIELTARGHIPVSVLLDWSYPHGEQKDVAIELCDGRHILIDMLAGFPAFKSSLPHEYAAILSDFARAVADGSSYGAEGLTVALLVDDIYKVGRRLPIDFQPTWRGSE